jgi:hypothetical protein
VNGQESREDKGKDTDRSEAGRRQVGDRSGKFHLNWHSKGIKNPKFGRADLKNLEFKSCLSKKIIKRFAELLTSFYPAKVQIKYQYVMKRLGNFIPI